MGETRGVEGEGGVRVSITFLGSKYTPAPRPFRPIPEPRYYAPATNAVQLVKLGELMLI